MVFLAPNFVLLAAVISALGVSAAPFDARHRHEASSKHAAKPTHYSKHHASASSASSSTAAAIFTSMPAKASTLPLPAALKKPADKKRPVDHVQAPITGKRHHHDDDRHHDDHHHDDDDYTKVIINGDGNNARVGDRVFHSRVLGGRVPPRVLEARHHHHHDHDDDDYTKVIINGDGNNVDADHDRRDGSGLLLKGEDGKAAPFLIAKPGAPSSQHLTEVSVDGDHKNVTAHPGQVVHARDAIDTRIPGTIDIVSSRPAPNTEVRIASLFLVNSEKNGTKDYFLDASTHNHTQVYLVVVPPTAEMAEPVSLVEDANDIPVQVQMDVFDAQAAGVVNWCATYNPAPSGPSMLFAEPCWRDGERAPSQSQTFLWNKATSAIAPMFWEGQDAGMDHDVEKNSGPDSVVPLGADVASSKMSAAEAAEVVSTLDNTPKSYASRPPVVGARSLLPLGNDSPQNVTLVFRPDAPMVDKVGAMANAESSSSVASASRTSAAPSSSATASGSLSVAEASPAPSSSVAATNSASSSSMAAPSLAAADALESSTMASVSASSTSASSSAHQTQSVDVLGVGESSSAASSQSSSSVASSSAIPTASSEAGASSVVASGSVTTTGSSGSINDVSESAASTSTASTTSSSSSSASVVKVADVSSSSSAQSSSITAPASAASSTTAFAFKAAEVSSSSAQASSVTVTSSSTMATATMRAAEVSDSSSVSASASSSSAASSSSSIPGTMGVQMLGGPDSSSASASASVTPTGTGSYAQSSSVGPQASVAAASRQANRPTMTPVSTSPYTWQFKRIVKDQ